MWFVAQGGRLLAETAATSGKAKRIRRNPSVTVAPCSARGRLRGEPIPAHVEFLPPSEEERAKVMARSPLDGKYDVVVNRESAFEILAKRAAKKTEAAAGQQQGKSAKAVVAGGRPEERSPLDEFLWGTKRRQGAIETAAKSATRTVASGIGRQILRGVLGGLFGGKR